MNFIADLAYLLSDFLFVAGLKQLSSPATARRGNQMAAIAMLIAIVVTLVQTEILSWTWIITGIIIGSLIGATAARVVKMTAMPEMVGLFNGFGGGASALVAGAEFMHIQQAGLLPPGEGTSIMLAMLIGAVTFSGSAVAFLKLAGHITGNPVTNNFLRFLNAVLFLFILGAGVYMVVQEPNMTLFLVFTAAALVLLGEVGVVDQLLLGGRGHHHHLVLAAAAGLDQPADADLALHARQVQVQVQWNAAHGGNRTVEVNSLTYERW